MENLKPNGQRAKNAITLIWIVLALKIVALISTYFQYDLLLTGAKEGGISAEAGNSNYWRERIVGLANIVAYGISIVTFLLWFRRAYFNLHQKVSNLDYSEGWAVGSWFVPIVNFYRPYRIMKELYQETNNLLIRNQTNVTSNLSSNTLGLWWTLWIMFNLLGQISYRYSARAVSIEDFTDSSILGMVVNSFAIALSFITVKIIKDYALVEPLLNEVVEEESIMNV